MPIYKVAIVEQQEGVPYLFTCIRYDSSVSLFFEVEGDTLVQAINKDLEYRPFYERVEFGILPIDNTDRMHVIDFDPIGAEQIKSSLCEVVLLPVKELGDDHFIMFCNNMKVLYKNLRGSVSQQPINLAQACDVKLHPTRGFMAFDGFGAIAGTLASAELL